MRGDGQCAVECGASRRAPNNMHVNQWTWLVVKNRQV